MFRLHTLGGLWLERADGSREDVSRPRRLALLAILAAAGRRAVSRDRILGILWPDEDAERARHALSQALYLMKRDMGVDVVAADPQSVRLEASAIWTDIEAFRSAIAASEWERAAELFRGPFLDGFSLADAPDFERWAEAERSQVAVEAERALVAAVETAAGSGAIDRAAEPARKLTALLPLDAGHALSYMKALAAAGDRPRAMAHARIYAETVRSELGIEPDARIRVLSEELRRQGSSQVGITPATGSPAARSGPTEAAEPTPTATVKAAGIGGLRRLGWVAVAIAAILGGGWWLRRAPPPAERPILAVGALRDLAGADSLNLAAVLTEMLATSLGRLTNLEVVANSRILELLPRDASDRAVGRIEAARRAGATEVLEGELTLTSKAELRLDLRRIDLKTGVVRRGYRIVAADRFALVDSATAALGADLRLAAPAGSVADISTFSPFAYRLYEEGLQLYYRDDAAGASRFFQAALREDSTFAMANYYAWISANPSGIDSVGDRAYRLASKAPERDRLIIMTVVEWHRGDPFALVHADSLAARFPNDPEALIAAARVWTFASMTNGRAPALINRVIALDSSAGATRTGICRLCYAFSLLASHFSWNDSLTGLDETVRRWKRLVPGDPHVWSVQATIALNTGGLEAAAAATRIEDSLRPTAVERTPEDLVRWSLAAGDLDDAERLCGAGSRVGTNRGSLRWVCTILLRYQGRYREANRLVIAGIWANKPSYAGLPPDQISRATLDLENRRGHLAAQEFLEIAKPWRTYPVPGIAARNVAWNLTLAATAMAASGEWIQAAALADTIEDVGKRSLYGRDPRLHFFIRGLLKAARGDHLGAVALYEKAAFSWTFGYTRINYELARSLLALHRPEDAIRPLQAALRGGIDGSNTYLSRTEVHELLGRAFAEAGQPDSAAAHYGQVVRAWAKADPEFRARYQEALRHATPATVKSD